MSQHNALELILIEILHVVNPLREDWETRMRIIDELRDVVSTIESLRGAKVEPYGSFLAQLFTRWGDLDISVELSNGSYIASPAKKLKQTLLGEILKALRRTGGFRMLQSVLHARVPILKIESRYQNISCDISINNLSGQMKSKFLLWISLIDRRFRDMVLLVKEWAKANDINDPKTGTLNSYSLSLLVIFHFQTCIPAILPPLQDLYDGNMAEELIGVRADVERHIEEVAVANIAKFRKERRVNHCSLPELFTSFFAKFCDISTRAVDQGICTYTGQWEDINTNSRWLPRTYALFIEDPFEQPENTARTVTSVQLTRIGEVFTHTHHRIITAEQHPNILIPLLVRHEISRFFPWVGYGNADINGGVYPRSNQNMHHSSRLSSQSQHRFQMTRQVSHPNSGPIHKSKQVSQGQARSVNPQVPKDKPAGHQPFKMTNKGAQTSKGQAPKVTPQQAKHHLPRTSLPDPTDNVASQRPVRAPQGRVQQVWRPKHSDK